MLPMLRQLEQQPQGPAVRGPCCMGTRLWLMHRKPVTRQLRDLPPGALGRRMCWQGSQNREGSHTLCSRVSASVTVITGELRLEASEACMAGGLFSIHGQPPGLCKFMCNFLM